jgi:hypothetical protein
VGGGGPAVGGGEAAGAPPQPWVAEGGGWSCRCEGGGQGEEVAEEVVTGAPSMSLTKMPWSSTLANA